MTDTDNGPSRRNDANARTPSVLAVERLAKLAGQGVPPEKMLNALDEVLIQWGREELDPEELRERVETLQSDLDVGAQAAEDYVAEADTDAARTAAGRQLAGLRAVRDRLSAVIGG